jgi:hypothetical protein
MDGTSISNLHQFSVTISSSLPQILKSDPGCCLNAPQICLKVLFEGTSDLPSKLFQNRPEYSPLTASDLRLIFATE